MATGGEEQLSNNQIVRLARAISSRDMESIALGYLGIEDPIIKNLQHENRDNMEAFNREIIRVWIHRNPEPNQVQILASLLYRAARECSCVDPQKVHEILEGSPTHEQSSRRELQELFKEFEELAEILRPETARAMKIEVAPWIHDYVVDMNELYCELELEKVDFKVHGEETKIIDDYRKLFHHQIDNGQDSGYNHRPSKIPVRKGLKSAIQLDNSKKRAQIFGTFRQEDKRRKPGQKLLFKGDPGIGKTTLLKKMGWDWAKRSFTRFNVVFVVLLKLVKPNQTIEDAIINQTPILKGLKLTQQKLDSFLEQFGSECLIVLDGLDEHVTGENTDVHKIIEGQKYLSCSVVVSSRPHSVRNLENFFHTVVRVNGFTLTEATKFATKILDSKNKVEQVLSFNPSNLGGRRLYNYPILLSFLCLLVREDDVDLSSQAIPIGEIYARMVRCLYKKYLIRKKKRFSPGEFVSILKSVGKLALDTLLSGNPLLRRSEVEKEIGPDAFDYGLLIGREDAHILIRDETADVFVTFPHRSIQEFLGALYFILMLNDGVSVESIIGYNSEKPIFLMNPLFLHFCLWIMYFGHIYFALKSGGAFKSLEKYCADNISRFDLLFPKIRTTYPALDVENSIKIKDAVMLRFVKGILMQLKNVKSFAVQSRKCFDLFQPLLGGFRETIMYVRVKDTEFACSNNQLIIRIASGWNQRMLKDIVEMLKRRVLFPDVYVLDDVSGNIWISILNILHGRYPRRLEYSSRSDLSRKTTELSIPYCQYLTHLAFRNVYLNDSTITALSQAVEDGRLPSLSHLSLNNCDGVRGNVSHLLRTPFPKLVLLNLFFTRLDFSDIEILLQILGESHKGLLPKLTSLVLSVFDPSLITLIRQKQLTLTGIFLHVPFLQLPYSSNVTSIEHITQDILPNLSRFGLSGHVLEAHIPFMKLTSLSLQSLDCNVKLFNAIATNSATLSHLKLTWCRSVRGNLFVLLSNNFPSLRTLILKSNNLSSADLHSLVGTFADGRLPKLNKLDLSYNTISLMELKSVFCFRCKWNQLEILDISDTYRGMYTHQKLADEFLLPEYFPYLRELTATHYLFRKPNKKWPNLVTLGVHKDSLENIAVAVDEGLLPNLSKLHIRHENIMTEYFENPAFFRLVKAGVTLCYKDSFEWPWPTE